MVRSPLQRVAAFWCLVMAGLLTLVQFSGLPHPPLPLYLIFTAVWIFGAAMLWWFPIFGGIGTALYGIIIGVVIFQMHGGSALNIVIAGGAFFATGLATAYLLERRRTRA